MILRAMPHHTLLISAIGVFDLSQEIVNLLHSGNLQAMLPDKPLNVKVAKSHMSFQGFGELSDITLILRIFELV